MSEPNQIFNRALLKMRRNRAAMRGGDDFLKRELCARLADRLDDIKRSFPRALDLGCHSGQMAEALEGSDKVGRLVQCDLSEAMMRHVAGLRLVADEECLPFAPRAFDLVLSAGSLHHVNDLPGTLAQIRRILTPDGLFCYIIPGAKSLVELRDSFAAVEAKHGIIRPHIAPFVEVRDAGNLLTRAGFALPVVDSDLLTLTYAHPLALLRDLQMMGETNMLLHQEKNIISRTLIPEVCEHYLKHYQNEKGRITATFELITCTAWTPDTSQPQPAKRGSGQVSLKDVLS